MNITDNDTPRATDMAGGTHTPAACLRVRVLRVTAGSITVTDGDGRRLELCLTGATGDRTYLSHIVRAGMRLNLVCPSTEGCRADAEIVVVEPDCLIDVTAVASCFEPYGESPALFVLGRLRPRASAAAVMLGNFASQLLDEEVHGRQDEYAGSVRKFFRHNGLAMAACSDLTPDFHAEARRQRDNIAHAITHGLADTGCWRSDRAVVEPSFICEMLGLQGRMDLMQDDLKVLVEQKSGKAAWQPRPDGLKAHDKHRVQLMLYMAVLHYAFGIAYSEMHSYLLYSKYHDGLLRTDRPDGLLARAMRLRNAIAATELACAGEGAGRLLWEITPERLVTDTRGMAFMRRFAQPRIEALLRPLHEASLLERAYYLRMYRFVAAEHLLAKTGTTGGGKAGFASVWLTPAAEKIESGDMMASMTLDPVSKDEDGISRLTLRTADKGSADMTNFRTGDTVIAYPYPAGGRPDARRTFVYRATVEDIATDKVTLRLRAPQSCARQFDPHPDRSWAIEHDFYDSTYTSLYRSLHQLLTATRRRRDILMAQRAPETDTTLSLNRDCGNGDISTLVLRAKQARDFFVVIGPPGTGKTSLGMLNILLEELSEPGTSVLLLAYTNRAVDEMCSKLIDDTGQPVIDFARLGSGLSAAEAYRPYLLSERMAKAANVGEVRRMIAGIRVFAGTVASLNAAPQLLELKRFDLAIIDEASQIPEPHLLSVLAARHGDDDAVARWVMIGDDRQLPAVVAQPHGESAVDDPMLRAIGLTDCRLSLFERMLKVYGDDPRVVFMLSRQGRMHDEIADFVNHSFYGSRLASVPLPHQTAPAPTPPAGCDGLHAMMLSRRFVFVASPDVSDGQMPAKLNLCEAEMIAAMVAATRDLEGDKWDPGRTVGVIVPYRAQIAAVRAALDRRDSALRHVTVDTVERYQGSQRDTIVYGTTVHDATQLAFLTESTAPDRDGHPVDRKLNVALTRARLHLVVVGNPATLAQAPLYAQLMDYARRRNAYLDVPPERFCRGDF